MASYDDGNWRDLPDHYRLKLDNVGNTAVTELMPGEYAGNGDNVDSRQITVAEIRWTGADSTISRRLPKRAGRR